ncbi:uncharacterized protein LOC121180059 [Toxotes jaculatrix]|uniref:uncharacterized protein LOC121180059 n=1 Tax=Toxotes jaculatrix TaxID=941984 RepID=UPI001B3AC532|nr:uncharacterized protein LOC121180059 [Toxotes jaculatrix]
MCTFVRTQAVIGSQVSWHPIKAKETLWKIQLASPPAFVSLSSGVLFLSCLQKDFDTAKMRLAILCLCLASTASAAPSAFHYLTHYTGSRPQVPPPQVKNPFTAGQPLPQTGIPGAYSVELIYPHRFPAGVGGPNGGQPYHGFIKYSIPQPPGRQSVEVYYPYDFSQQRIMANIPPLTNVPQVLPFEYPPQTIPQQTLNIPSFDANPLPSQDPLQPLQQDQPTQVNQMPAKV